MFVALLLVALLANIAEASTHTSRVRTLNITNFDKEVALGREKGYFVATEAPWCSHCQHLRPVWEQLASDLESDGILVGKVNGPEQRALVQRLGIQGYPTLLFFKGGKVRIYQGSRNLPHLTSFAKEEWRTVRPEPFHRTPNNLLGYITGLFFRIPSAIDGTYKHMRLTWGLSVPSVVLVGFVFLLSCSYCFVYSIDYFFGSGAVRANDRVFRAEEILADARRRQRLHRD